MDRNRVVESGPREDRASEVSLTSYRRLADVFHDVLSEHRLEYLLERIADTLADLIPYDTLTIYQADEARRVLSPVLARDLYSKEVLDDTNIPFGAGITGWAVEQRQPVRVNDSAHDERRVIIPGTPEDEHEAIVSVPLIAKGSVKGALNVYRLGREQIFSVEEFELAKRFGDAAALALANAQERASLERQAQTDALTGLYNHRYFHERVRAELSRAHRSGDALTVLMLDIDDFKRTNDVHGHFIGDQVLAQLGEVVRAMVRASDVVCRVGGEEFAVIMPSCDSGSAVSFAVRLATRLRGTSFGSIGGITLSVGIAEGPRQAGNPRELVACSEAAMMTAKAEGKDRIVVFDDKPALRPDDESDKQRDVRSIAHMKMLQSLAGKLNTLNDVGLISESVIEELRTYIEYDACCLYLLEGDQCVPVAAWSSSLPGVPERPAMRLGEGITGRAALLGKSLLVCDTHTCDWIERGPEEHPESLIAIPLRYGSRSIGVITVSKEGSNTLDDDDVRLLEVLAGHAAVVIENARLYEAQRHEAEHAKALLHFSDAMAKATSLDWIAEETVRVAAGLTGARQTLLWMQEGATGGFHVTSDYGMSGEPTAERILGMRVDPDTARRFLDGAGSVMVIDRDRIERFFGPKAAAMWGAIAVAPLRLEDDLTGWITVRNPGGIGGSFTKETLDLLAGLCHQASVAMQKVSLYKKQAETAETANALLGFATKLATSENLDVVLSRTVEVSARLVGCDATAVWLQDGPSRAVRMLKSWGPEVPWCGWAESEGMPWEAAKSLFQGEAPFVLMPEDYRGVFYDVPDDPHQTAYAVCPLKLEDDRMGALVAGTRSGRTPAFSDKDLRLLAGIADEASLAIIKAGSFQSLEETFLSTVEALASALEARDEYALSHARWIADMALRVGVELGLTGERLKNLELGALFHDVGKIGVPSELLRKQSPLYEREWRIIQAHPEIGERILAPIDRFAQVRPIVRHCHERYDGGGYPDGKAGEDIPFEARIVFVCDTWHAMITDRPYRRRLSIEEATGRLRDAAGSQLDPRVVGVFLDLVGRGPELVAIDPPSSPPPRPA